MTTHRLVPLVAAACALVLVALAVLRGEARNEGPGATVERRTAPHRGSGPDVDPARESSASAGGRSAVPTVRDLASLGGGGDGGSGAAQDLVQIFVRTPEGEPLLGGSSPLPVAMARFVRPRVVRAAVPPSSTRGVEATEVQPYSYPGWRGPGHFGRVPRPAGPACAVLTFGHLVVASAPFVDGASEVVLVVDPDAVVARACGITGTLPGVVRAAELVRVRCVDVGLLIEVPLEAFGSGESFEVAGLPPGPARLIVGPSSVRVARGILQHARETGAGPVPLGPRVRDEEQWRFRLTALGNIARPLAEIELTLAPGEARDLGALPVQTASAALLRLRGGEEESVRAGAAEVRLLGASRSQQPRTWSFQDELLVFPLPEERCELLVLVDGRGALVELTPAPLLSDRPPAPRDVSTEELSVVRLPAEVDAELRTASGRVVPGAVRWTGASYRGVELDAATRLVPPGRYGIAEGAGAAGRTFEVTGGERIDVTEGGVLVRRLGGER
ncbi:MAG: hypothetical protein AAGB93_09510 [Planctomycetota bacterium]